MTQDAIASTLSGLSAALPTLSLALSFSTQQLLLVALAGLLLGGLIWHSVLRRLWPNRHRAYTWLYAMRNHRKYGEPCKADIILDRDGYSLGFCGKRKSALWVSYIICKRSISVDKDRSASFFADPDLPEAMRVSPDVYRNSGFDKGHLAPSAAIDFSRRSNDETFAMSNVSPQHPKLNRQAWKRLEAQIRQWTATKGKLVVITGPVFTQRPRRLNGTVAIPKHFYKVVFALRHQRCIGFVFPNTAVKASQVWDHAVSVREVEKLTGYKFFVELTRGGTRIKNKLQMDWWREDS